MAVLKHSWKNQGEVSFYYPCAHCSHSCWKQINSPFTNCCANHGLISAGIMATSLQLALPEEFAGQSSVVSDVTITRGELAFEERGVRREVTLQNMQQISF